MVDLSTYRQDPPPGSLLRRKWVRRFIGKANCLRICSVSWRSLSLRKSFNCFFLFFFLFSKCFFQNADNGFIFWPA
jgi:hypothetical protein